MRLGQACVDGKNVAHTAMAAQACGSVDNPIATLNQPAIALTVFINTHGAEYGEVPRCRNTKQLVAAAYGGAIEIPVAGLDQRRRGLGLGGLKGVERSVFARQRKLINRAVPACLRGGAIQVAVAGLDQRGRLAPVEALTWEVVDLGDGPQHGSAINVGGAIR